ncbi:MAG: Fic family protein [Phycisphaeraceae bacterium]|nr:Fic family protein [Phycisphaeraceae bacterium]
MDRDVPPCSFQDLSRLLKPENFALLGKVDVRELFKKYRPWRKVRAIARALQVEPEAAWATVKLGRMAAWRRLDLQQSNGREFGISSAPQLIAALHRVDRATGGGGAAALHAEDGVLADPASRYRLRIRTLIDEAAESSLIEGAATTRKDAVDMLRSGREPRSIGERMVINNYLAMQQVKRWLQRPLSTDMLLELQTILTEQTLERPDEAGRLRRSDENVRVVDERDNTDLYTPPLAEALPARLAALCDFANRDHEDEHFIHPIVKASILHFMIGYEHPFVDGNGRTARAVFYWHALRNGYSIFEYTGISELIRKGYARYPQAFVDTELDDGDLTYFVLYKLDIIEQALDRLGEHLRHEEEKVRRSERLLKLAKDLNLRQRLLLEHSLRHPGTQYTVKSHMNSNGIVAATARTDLDDLVRRRLMTTTKRGREVIYLVTSTLAERLAKKGL